MPSGLPDGFGQDRRASAWCCSKNIAVSGPLFRSGWLSGVHPTPAACIVVEIGRGADAEETPARPVLAAVIRGAARGISAAPAPRMAPRSAVRLPGPGLEGKRSVPGDHTAKRGAFDRCGSPQGKDRGSEAQKPSTSPRRGRPRSLSCGTNAFCGAGESSHGKLSAGQPHFDQHSHATDQSRRPRPSPAVQE